MESLVPSSEPKAEESYPSITCNEGACDDSLPASKILMVVVVDDAKDGGADKEADPIDD